MSTMARKTLLPPHPLALQLRALRTQAWPDGEERELSKKESYKGYKGRHVREINRYEEPKFDATAAKQQELRLVLQVRDLLVQRRGGLIDMTELAIRHPKLAETAVEYPGIFNVVDYGTQSRLLSLTPEAQFLVQQEDCLKEERSLRVLPKLLMLSGKRLPLENLGFWAMDLGLPNDLSGFLSRHREVFEVSTTLDCTTWVKLGSWDPALAVSVAEIEDRRREDGSMSQMEMYTPKGYVLSKRHRKVLARFREAPFVSPYTDFRDLEPLKIKFEKHAVAGMQELLSLTTHKNFVLSTLAELKTEFSFSNKPLDLLLRHPEYFYVSPVGKQETVFLRSAYCNGDLVKKSPLVLVREQFLKLLDRQREY